MDKIVCFGKNYADHMAELGDAPVKQPVIFLKPPSVLKKAQQWNEVVVADLMNEATHYECELVLRLKKGGYCMSLTEAEEAISTYTIGLDMTLREKQANLKNAGHPWTTAKVFPDAAIIGPWLPYEENEFLDTPFSFTLDNTLKQKGTGQQMLFKPTELIVYASHAFPLKEGDVLFTGTPAGVGAVKANSVGVLNLGHLSFQVRWKALLSD